MFDERTWSSRCSLYVVLIPSHVSLGVPSLQIVCRTHSKASTSCDWDHHPDWPYVANYQTPSTWSCSCQSSIALVPCSNSKPVAPSLLFGHHLSVTLKASSLYLITLQVCSWNRCRQLDAFCVALLPLRKCCGLFVHWSGSHWHSQFLHLLGDDLLAIAATNLQLLLQRRWMSLFSDQVALIIQVVVTMEIGHRMKS